MRTTSTSRWWKQGADSACSAGEAVRNRSSTSLVKDTRRGSAGTGILQRPPVCCLSLPASSGSCQRVYFRSLPSMLALPEPVPESRAPFTASLAANAGIEIARVVVAANGIRAAASGILDVLEARLPIAGSAVGIRRRTQFRAFFSPQPGQEQGSEEIVEWIGARGSLAALSEHKVGMSRSIASLVQEAGQPIVFHSNSNCGAFASSAEWELLRNSGAGNGSDGSDYTDGGNADSEQVYVNRGDTREPDTRIVLRLADGSSAMAMLVLSPATAGAVPDICDALAELAPVLVLALATLARERDDRVLRKQERMMLTALAALSQPVLMLNATGVIRDANVAAHAAYGYERDELAGLPFRHLVDPRSDESEPALMHRADMLHAWRGTPAFTPAVSGMLRSREMHRRKDGSAFSVSVLRAPVVDDDGMTTGEVVIVRDLTAELQLEAHVRQHDRLAALGELVGGVAHELNNPLTGISAFAQLLLEDPLTNEQLESVRMVKREADRAASVISDLLLFSRRTGSRMSALDLNELVKATVRLRAYHFRSGGVNLVMELSESLPYIHGDSQKLQQVLLHLLSNAEDALGDEGERMIRIRTFPEGEDEGVVLEVHDTGRGMSDEARAHAFDPFFTTKHTGAGTGLGLSVAYGIVELHGGMLTVESSPGNFTTVRVLLPCSADSVSG